MVLSEGVGLGGRSLEALIRLALLGSGDSPSGAYLTEEACSSTRPSRGSHAWPRGCHGSAELKDRTGGRGDGEVGLGVVVSKLMV